ncbi:MAG: SGNH/GDSL hydrolase family protein, partial [Sulfitobacter sp.]
MFDISLRVLMLPILLAQGFRVRARALRLSEADGPRFGQVGDGPPLSILILGDSSAAGVGVGQQSQALSGQLIRLL